MLCTAKDNINKIFIYTLSYTASRTPVSIYITLDSLQAPTSEPLLFGRELYFFLESDLKENPNRRISC